MVIYVQIIENNHEYMLNMQTKNGKFYLIQNCSTNFDGL
jgi:hypothetical protein